MTTPSKKERPTYPPGRQPYDRLNAIRIGAFSGGILGAIVAATMRGIWAVAILVGAVIGGALGAWWDRRSRP